MLPRSVWHAACGASSGATAATAGARCHFELAPMSSNCRLCPRLARMSTGCHIRQIYPQGTVRYSASCHIPVPLPLSLSFSFHFVSLPAMAHLTAVVQFQLAAQFAADSPMAIMSIMWHCQPQQQPRVIPANAPRQEERDEWVSESRKVIGQHTLVPLNLCNLRLSLSLHFDFYLFPTS